MYVFTGGGVLTPGFIHQSNMSSEEPGNCDADQGVAFLLSPAPGFLSTKLCRVESTAFDFPRLCRVATGIGSNDPPWNVFGVPWRRDAVRSTMKALFFELILLSLAPR